LLSFLTIKKSLYQRVVKVTNNKYTLFQSKLQKLESSLELQNYLLNLGNSKYLVKNSAEKCKKLSSDDKK
jgi:hypothetical protein